MISDILTYVRPVQGTAEGKVLKLKKVLTQRNKFCYHRVAVK